MRMWEEWGADAPPGGLAVGGYLAAPKPVPTGIPELDHLLGGGLMPGLSTLTGESSSGKSAIAANIAANMAARGVAVLYASLEMGWSTVHWRMASAWSVTSADAPTVSWSDVVSGKALKANHPDIRPEDDMGRLSVTGQRDDPVLQLAVAWTNGPGRNVVVRDSVHDADTFCQIIASGADEAKASGRQLAAFLDYAQLMEPGGGKQAEKEYERMNEVTRRIQRQAIASSVPTLALSSMRNLTNKEREDMAAQCPPMTLMRGTGYLGYSSEQVIAVACTGAGPQRGTQRRRLWCVKNKSGRSGTHADVLLWGGYCYVAPDPDKPGFAGGE